MIPLEAVQDMHQSSQSGQQRSWRSGTVSTIGWNLHESQGCDCAKTQRRGKRKSSIHHHPQHKAFCHTPLQGTTCLQSLMNRLKIAYTSQNAFWVVRLPGGMDLELSEGDTAQQTRIVRLTCFPHSAALLPAIQTMTQPG